MMHNYFETKIRYQKMMDNGKEKFVNENYLVDAVTFGEAEKRIIKELEPFGLKEMSVSGIKFAKFTELFRSNSEEDSFWYKVRVVITTLDNNGREKKNRCSMFVQSDSIENAKKRLDSELGKSMIDYSVDRIIETDIMDVYDFKKEE